MPAALGECPSTETEAAAVKSKLIPVLTHFAEVSFPVRFAPAHQSLLVGLIVRVEDLKYGFCLFLELLSFYESCAVFSSYQVGPVDSRLFCL